MPAPIEFQIAFAAALARAIAPAVDHAWDAAMRVTESPIPGVAIANAGPERVARGAARSAVMGAIAHNGARGATREDIRRLVPRFMGGPIKVDTLKAALKVLRDQGRIILRDGKWYPATRETAANRPPP